MIVDFQAEKLARNDHLTGPARCIACGHEWQAVAPAGEFDAFECPSCHLHKGVLVYGVMPESWWECGCGCCLFSVSGVTGDLVADAVGAVVGALSAEYLGRRVWLRAAQDGAVVGVDIPY